MSISKDPLKKLTHVRMSKGGNQTHQSTSAHSHSTHHAHASTNSENTEKNESTANSSNGVAESERLAAQTAPLTQGTDSEISSDRPHSVQPEHRQLADGDKTEPKASKVGLDNNEYESKRPASRLPGFLSKFTSDSSSEPVLNSTHRALAVIEEKVKDNPNSFGSIFTREHEEISGIQRVFKKSIAFLVINLMLFGVLSLASINLLSLPIWFTAVISVFYIASSCLFFIIVADRSYLWLSIAGQVILMLLVHSFLGQGFNLITIITSLLSAALIFSAYSELEKIQLGSRLFFISHITGESIRILTTVVAIILSLGLFNSMISAGTENYVEKNILSSDLVLNRVLIGENPNLSLNRLFLKGNTYYTADNEEYTFRDFLTFNYKGGKAVLTQEESNDLIISCQTRPNTTTAICNKELNTEKDKRLEAWREEAYPKLGYDLDKVITPTEFETIVKQHYLFLIRDFTRYDSGLALIPSKYVVPAFFAIALFALLLIIKPIFGWLSYFTVWIVWKTLRGIGFARIEIEAVEAEIVSI